MPVARIITRTPAESEELRRVLTAAGYSVKFAAPEEEFDDADLVVAAANVHYDYALQYASEVAAEAGADVIVAPGVVSALPANPKIVSGYPSDAYLTDSSLPPAALEQPPSPVISGESERDFGIVARATSVWQEFRHKRAIAAEAKRLEQERHAHERQERERQLREQRAAAEAQMVAERERVRVERAAEEERVRREQEELRAREMERARAEAQSQRARMAVEAEHARAEQERAWREQEQLRALEAERIRMEEERAREQREQVARDAALVAAAHEVPVPTPVTPVEPYVPAAPVVSPATYHSAPARVPQLPRPATRRKPAHHVNGRQKRFQRAALVASVVALAAMIALAILLNVHPSAPMPASVTNNPVQEQSPFGAASVGTPAGQPKPTQAQAARVSQPSKHAPLPQSDAPAAPTKPSATTDRHIRRHRDNDIAQDEVIIHHYGQQPQPKHPPAAQTRAGVPKYTDE